MSNKLLTISIAAYNVSSYIGQALDSLVASRFIDQLEIFVVDDGGQDETLAIARQYQEKYPTSVFPIHKGNGGYGTTVNYSMEHATGKYFKLLDGDDWVQTDELDRLVEHLAKIDTDVVVTPFLRGPKMSDMETIEYSSSFRDKEEFFISDSKAKRLIGMWALCYKTEMLRQSGLQLPPKLFYTDQIFCTVPFAVAKTMQYVDAKVYCYRVGREGQSVSRESRIKNAQMTLDIAKMLVEFVADHKQNANYHYLLHRVSSYYFSALKTILLHPVSSQTIVSFQTYDKEIKAISQDIFAYVTTFGKTGKLIAIARKSSYKGLYLFKILYPKGLPNWS